MLLVLHAKHSSRCQFSTLQAVLQRTYKHAQEAEAAGTVLGSGKAGQRIAPEIQLVQSKRDIEEPTVTLRAEQIAGSGSKI
jgi:hypothetical protein